MLALKPRRTETMQTRDGVSLVADIWEPDGDGPFPVLLMRQAYGRKIGTSLCYAPPEWYASHGYIVIMQDVRGRGDSGGDFVLFEHEATDGADTIAWAASLPRSNGRVGMFGFSFQGSNQLLAAGEKPAALKAVAPAMIGWQLDQDWAYENGAFPMRANLGWATQLAAETARLQGDYEAQQALFAASRGMSFNGRQPTVPAHEALLAKYSHYTRWRETPPGDAYWDKISPASRLSEIAELAPAVLLIGGWYDSHLPGTLEAYRALSPDMPTRLIVGPWSHFPWDRHIGDVDVGEAAITDIDQQQIAFFDQYLKAAPIPDTKPVRLFDMGACCWQDFPTLSTGTVPSYPVGTGRSAIDTRDGILSASTAPTAPSESLTLDPWRPSGPCGGSFGFPGGPVDRARTDARSDVLTFTMLPLEFDQLLAGTITGCFEIESEYAGFDLYACVSRIDQNGKVHPLAEGYALTAPGQTSLPLRGTCVTLKAGERLRLSLSLSCFPVFPINPGTGASPITATLDQQQVTTVHFKCGSGTYLLLPWIKQER